MKGWVNISMIFWTILGVRFPTHTKTLNVYTFVRKLTLSNKGEQTYMARKDVLKLTCLYYKKNIGNEI